MATYSIATVGRQADSPYLVNTTTLPDSSATPGGESAAMQNGTPILCKNPDGSQSWYTIDAERSLPGVSRVLKRVSP